MDRLIRTHLEKPQSRADVVNRPRLMAELAAGLEKRLILLVAPAGYGKTTLLAEWLQTNDLPSAWLSLDHEDNDLTTFLAYFVAAIQTLNPRLCKEIQSMLKGAQMPPVSKLAGMLINELVMLPKEAIIVLEDYHLVKERAIHELIAALVSRWPRNLHLVIASRSDPALQLAQWRAHGYVTEIRAVNLRFTREEAQAFFLQEVGFDLPDPMLDDLLEVTEGWIAGLRLAAISIHDRASRRSKGEAIDLFPDHFRESRANRHIADFLLEDVFSRQPRAVRQFLMRTSILDQFTAPLCEALGDDDAATSEKSLPASDLLTWIERSNLFIVPLDGEGRWYRYHHLFRELLANRLRKRFDAATIARLHCQAGAWLAKHGFTEQAMQHFLKGEAPERAAELVVQRRHEMLNNDDWRTLERWLNLLPEDVVQQQPALLVTRAWVRSFQGRSTAVGVAVQQAIALAPDNAGVDTDPYAVHAELEIHLCHAALFNCRFDDAVAHALNALNRIPPAHSYVLGSALTAYGLSVQAAGQAEDSLLQIEQFLTNDAYRQGPTLIRVLLTLAWMSCIAGDWGKALRTAEYALKLSEARESILLEGWSHLMLGWCHYQNSDLVLAVQHFNSAAQNRYSGVHWRCAISSMAGLSMAYQMQGNSAMANEIARQLDEFALEARDHDPMSEAQSFRAHLNVLQGNIAPALEWASGDEQRYVPRPYLWTESPSITRLRTLIAYSTRTSLARAAELLPAALELAQKSQNVWRTVELLALQALLLAATDRREAALHSLDHAMSLGRAGHFVRAFVDLGDGMCSLLEEMVRQNRQADYARELLDGFGKPDHKPKRIAHTAQEELIEPMTMREMEVLTLMGGFLSNDEIAKKLFISPVTVKSHIRNIFAKLGVNRRRFAIARARELGLLPEL